MSVEDPRSTGKLEVAATLWGEPAGYDIAERAESVLDHRSVRGYLDGTRHRLLAYEVVDDGKAAPSTAAGRYRATVYDYTNNQVVLVEGGGDAPDAVVTEHGGQPLPTAEEFAAAVDVLGGQAELGTAVADGRLRPYRPMPPLVGGELPDGAAERVLGVGLLPAEDSGLRHEIVGVDMVREQVVRFEDGAPAGAMADDRVCGLPQGTFQPTVVRGTPGQYQVTVTRDGVELWRFVAVRPAASSGTNGSGIELRTVDYRGTRVLDRAHVPILNVRYDGDACGPYRDWQWEESWIQADGTDVAPGFRRCPTPALTVLETGNDTGNFLGVGLYTEGDETVLVSEMEAGWYRYISEWRLHSDGTIRPRFGFTAVENPCVCVAHHHHVYWRFDFDIRTAGRNQVREFNDPPLVGADNWHTLRFETRRPRDVSRQRRWAVTNRGTGEGYMLTPGPEDGEADSFGVGDLWALRYRDGEIDDGQGFTTDPELAKAQLDRFVNRRARIDNHDVVVWYAAHFTHDVGAEEGFGHRVGPDLTPVNWR